MQFQYREECSANCSEKAIALKVPTNSKERAGKVFLRGLSLVFRY